MDIDFLRKTAAIKKQGEKAEPKGVEEGARINSGEMIWEIASPPSSTSAPDMAMPRTASGMAQPLNPDNDPYEDDVDCNCDECRYSRGEIDSDGNEI